MNENFSVTPITYHADSAVWFFRIRHLSHAVWLDSGHPGSTYGRFDILCANPLCTLETRGEETQIKFVDGRNVASFDDPFELLKALLPNEAINDQNLPFIGGGVGYFGYDLGRRLEKLPARALNDLQSADMCVGVYPWAIIQDHHTQDAYLITNPSIADHLNIAYDFSEVEAWREPYSELQSQLEIKNFLQQTQFSIGHFKNDLSKDVYYSAIEKIKGYIQAGDCYQVNFAQRFATDYSGDPLAAYLVLRDALPSPFSAFFQFERGAVLSLSPERFIHIQGECVETKPIKGTVSRGATSREDAAAAQWLANSPKNRAENVMIVDLLRNDLSKHCVNVKVPALWELQSFANVHHLVSTVTAELGDGVKPTDVLRGCFPGGSITGAPKIRAMEIIDELEPTRRSVYCGSVGYISAHGHMDTSIAIRTLVCAHNKIYCWGGGGIVADSEAELEYRESLAKVKVLMDALETYFRS